MAGMLPALTTLAAANGLYLVLLLLGGMIVPLAKLPGAAADAVAGPSGRGALRRLPRGADAGHGADPRLGRAGLLGRRRPDPCGGYLSLGMKGDPVNQPISAGTRVSPA